MQETGSRIHQLKNIPSSCSFTVKRKVVRDYLCAYMLIEKIMWQSRKEKPHSFCNYEVVSDACIILHCFHAVVIVGEGHTFVLQPKNTVAHMATTCVELATPILVSDSGVHVWSSLFSSLVKVGPASPSALRCFMLVHWRGASTLLPHESKCSKKAVVLK